MHLEVLVAEEERDERPELGLLRVGNVRHDDHFRVDEKGEDEASVRAKNNFSA